MTVTYSFYTGTYGGSDIPEANWTKLSLKAEQRLRHYTLGRLPDSWGDAPWENNAKCAVCEMAEAICSDDKRAGKTSENTDGYSVSYDLAKSLSTKLYDIAYIYLGYTGLMSLGVEEC